MKVVFIDVKYSINNFSGPTSKQIAVVMLSSQPRTVVSIEDSHKGKFNGIML